MRKVVATGVWLYDGTVPTTVRVFMLDYDFWFEIGKADGDLEPGEVPVLNSEGRIYYVQHRHGNDFWPDSPGFHTLAEAQAAAQAAVPNQIRWG